MKTPKKKRAVDSVNTRTAEEILLMGGLSPDQIKQARQRQALHDAAVITNVLMRFVTFGAEVLQEKYDFTVDDSTEWAKLVISKSQEWVSAGKEDDR